VFIDDIDGDIRSTTPDLGADEGDFMIYTGATVTAPENVNISVSGANIEISWDAVDGAAGYYVYASEEPYATLPWGEPLMTIDAPNTTAVISPSTSFKFFYISAFD